MGTENEDRKVELEAVLGMFSEVCPRPTIRDVVEWRREHPAYSRQILTFAIDLLEICYLSGPEAGHEPDERELEAAGREFLARARSRDRRRRPLDPTTARDQSRGIE